MFKSLIGGNSIKKSFIYFSIDQTTKVNWVLKIHAIIEQNASVKFPKLLYVRYMYAYRVHRLFCILHSIKKLPLCYNIKICGRKKNSHANAPQNASWTKTHRRFFFRRFFFWYFQIKCSSKCIETSWGYYYN